MNKDQLEIIADALVKIGDKLSYLTREYSDHTLQNMAEWLKNSDIKEGVKVKHRNKDKGIGIVKEIEIEQVFPLIVDFGETIDDTCCFHELEIVVNDNCINCSSNNIKLIADTNELNILGYLCESCGAINYK